MREVALNIHFDSTPLQFGNFKLFIPQSLEESMKKSFSDSLPCSYWQVVLFVLFPSNKVLEMKMGSASMPSRSKNDTWSFIQRFKESINPIRIVFSFTNRIFPKPGFFVCYSGPFILHWKSMSYLLFENRVNSVIHFLNLLFWLYVGEWSLQTSVIGEKKEFRRG